MIKPLITLGALGAVLAMAMNEPQGGQECAVEVHLTLQTYDGPIVIEDACLSAPAVYADGVLTLQAVDLGGGIFRDGFDPEDLP